MKGWNTFATNTIECIESATTHYHRTFQPNLKKVAECVKTE